MFNFFRRLAEPNRGLRQGKKTNNGRDTTEMDHLRKNDNSENEHRVVPATPKIDIEEEKFRGPDMYRSTFEAHPLMNKLKNIFRLWDE